MNYIQRIITLLTIMLMPTIMTKSFAQIDVTAELDSIQMFIGQQVHLTLTATLPDDQTAEFPVFAPRQEITPGVEVLEREDVSEKSIGSGRKTITKRYTLTSFDDTLYYIPPIPVRVNGKEYPSKSLALKVMTINTDTIPEDQFFPPKDIQKNPFKIEEWYSVAASLIIAIALILLTIYLRKRLKSNQPITRKIKPQRKQLMLHEKALEAIKHLKSSALMQDINQKAYYTELTDILRKYLKERFAIDAMEMTSDEILEALEAEPDSSKLDEMRQVFATADLVKFANQSSQISQREGNMQSVIDYIINTKIETTINDTTKNAETTHNRERDSFAKSMRWTWLTAILAIAAIVFALWRAITLIE